MRLALFVLLSIVALGVMIGIVYPALAVVAEAQAMLTGYAFLGPVGMIIGWLISKGIL